MSATFETLMRLDAELARAGHLPLTAWWREQLREFYGHPTATTLVARVGRGGVKSHTSAKVALNETLFGDWHIPPGERHFWAFVSVSKDEAGQRLLLLESFLRALGIRFETRGDEIALLDLPRGFRVFAAQVASSSGFRCYGRTLDEAAKMRSGVDGANPAGEVAASLTAMCVTHPGARQLLISSPVSFFDYHAQRFELGNTPDQLVATAPTWVANESVSEADTRTLEPDERVWRREYAAIPQAGASSVWTVEQIDRAMRPKPAPRSMEWHRAVMPLDMSSGRGDAAVIAPCAWGWVQLPPEAYQRKDLVDHKGYVIRPLGDFVRDEHGRRVLDPSYPGEARPVLLFWDLVAFEGKFGQFISFDDLAQAIAFHAERWGTRSVVGDQREEYALSSALPRLGLRFTSFPWTNANKGMAVERLSRLLRDGMIVVPNDPKLRQEMLAFQERILPSGTITWSGRADDRVAVLLTAMLADIHGLIPGSPIRGANTRGLSSWEQRINN